MLEQTHKHRRIAFTVKIGAHPGRRFRWTFETSTGLKGEGITAFGRETAFKDGKRAAEEAIDLALGEK